MSYLARFNDMDDLVAHLRTYVPTILDESVKAKYVGFLSVNAVTVFELAIKGIFIEFAKKKHIVFGNFVNSHFSRINGQIKVEDLKGHIKRFGDKYLNKFKKLLAIQKDNIFYSSHKDILVEYSNLVTCRHNYVHAGSPTLTFQEVLEYYDSGKEIIEVLHKSMQR